MMTLRYTHEDLGERFPNCRSMADLFRAVEKETEKSGRVVCQFRINGVNFTEADEKRIESYGMEDVRIVEVLVDTPENLLNSVILNWIEELPRMVTQADKIASSLREEGFDVHYTPMVRLIDSCQFLNESLVSIRTFTVVQEQMRPEDWTQCEKMMTKAVSETVEAFEKRDSNWMADVIEYDLANSLQRWSDILRDLYGCLTTGGHLQAPGPALRSENE